MSKVGICGREIGYQPWHDSFDDIGPHHANIGRCHVHYNWLVPAVRDALEVGVQTPLLQLMGRQGVISSIWVKPWISIRRRTRVQVDLLLHHEVIDVAKIIGDVV